MSCRHKHSIESDPDGKDHEKTRRGLALPLLFGACAQFQNEDAGQPEVEKSSADDKPNSVVQCIAEEAKKHDSKFLKTSIPQGVMLEFGDSNVIKVRYDNGETTYRFYPGVRHPSNLWIEGAGKKCAPADPTSQDTSQK